MNLPAALPASPSSALSNTGLSNTAQAPAQTPETGAEFAVLLGLMLETGTAQQAAIPGEAATPTPIAQPVTGNPDGKSLPDELPPLPAMPDPETPEADMLSATIVLPVVAVLIPLPPITPPTEGAREAQDTPAPHYAVPVRKIPAQLTESIKADTPAPSQPQAPRPEQAAAALPRLMLPAADEAAPSASSAPTAPAQPRLVAASLDGAAAPTPNAPQLTFAMAEAPTISPTATAPNTMRAQAPHDFATLVDRLVEARDTARAVQAPQTVSASLAHADFGDIAIRFEHGGHALSVALSNPDPDFARAVQAAAPAAQTATQNNDGGAAPGRQDASGQQQAGSTSGQSPQSQAQQRGSGSLARNTAQQDHSRDEQHSGRSGIFA